MRLTTFPNISFAALHPLLTGFENLLSYIGRHEDLWNSSYSVMDSFDGQNLGRATIRGSHEARFDIERGDIDLFVIPRTEFCNWTTRQQRLPERKARYQNLLVYVDLFKSNW